MVKFMVEHGADVNKADEAGKTPLQCALNEEYIDIAQYLVEHGANVNDSASF